VTLPCPNNVCDSTVQLRQGDLLLCDFCNQTRFPSASSAVPRLTPYDSEDHLDLPNDDADQSPVVSGDWKCSELLCFVSDKVATMTADHLVDICMKFYKDEEIIAARKVLVDAGLRLVKRQGGNKIAATVVDIVEAVLKPKVKLPEFYAKQLSRLPPVDMKHCDTAAILLELQSLRCEVREFGKLQAEVASLRIESKRTAVLQSELVLVQQELPTLRAAIHDMANSKLAFCEASRMTTSQLSATDSRIQSFHAEMSGLKSDIESMRADVQQLKCE